MVGLLGGRLDVIYSQYSLIKDYIANGDFTCLGVLAKDRLKLAPDVPTFGEMGYPLVFDKFFYLSFPKGTPRAIIDKVNLASKRVAENPEFIEECTRNFVEANYFTPENSVEYIKKQYDFFSTFKPMIDERR